MNEGFDPLPEPLDARPIMAPAVHQRKHGEEEETLAKNLEQVDSRRDLASAWDEDHPALAWCNDESGEHSRLRKPRVSRGARHPSIWQLARTEALEEYELNIRLKGAVDHDEENARIKEIKRKWAFINRVSEKKYALYLQQRLTQLSQEIGEQKKFVISEQRTVEDLKKRLAAVLPLPMSIQSGCLSSDNDPIIKPAYESSCELNGVGLLSVQNGDQVDVSLIERQLDEWLNSLGDVRNNLTRGDYDAHLRNGSTYRNP